MKASLLPVIGLWCLLLSAKAGDNQASHIEVIESYNKRFVIHSYADGSVDDSAVSYVKVRIPEKSEYEGRELETELLLLNTAKSVAEKWVIYQNADRTIVGFTACAALLDYKINIVYITSEGEVVINQNFNQKLAEMLKQNSPTTDFDPTSLYLDHIHGRNLYIAYQSDSGKGSFKFEVRLWPDGYLQMVPNSLKFDN